MLRNNLSDVIRLSRITDNLLFLTKADNNIIELRMQWFDLNNLMVNIVEQLRYKAETAGVSIEEDYKEHLEAHGDIFLLEQAFSNLVENAIKYTPEGGRIVIKTGDDKSSVLVRVGDTGIGIPESDIPHIFERFYRVNKERSRKLGGTGLGLSITEWIVNAHDGKIYVESKVGEGSQFTVALPKTAD
jgi:signal transduction histidine kinase